MSEFQGYCYSIANADNAEGLTWDQASNKCGEMGTGYKLASIHSERESAFIYTMLSQLEPSFQKSQLWIAANDRGDTEDEGKWKNSDNTAFDYTHWATGEPNGSPEVI